MGSHAQHLSSGIGSSGVGHGRVVVMSHVAALSSSGLHTAALLFVVLWSGLGAACRVPASDVGAVVVVRVSRGLSLAERPEAASSSSSFLYWWGCQSTIIASSTTARRQQARQHQRRHLV